MPRKIKRSGKKLPTKRTTEAAQPIPAFDRATEFVIENWRLIVVGLVLLGVIAVAVVFWMRGVEKRELQASYLLSQGVSKLKEADDLSGEEAETAYNEALEAFENLAQEYGSTESGELGIFYVGKCLSRLKRYGEAARHYEEFLSIADSNLLYRSLALRNLGFAHHNEKNYEKALASFRELAEMEGGFLRGESILAMAQIYEDMGQKQDALEAYRDFLKEHPDSAESNRIHKRVAFLEKQLQ
jgi:tetratricopeptide (TPR) repeat protein